MAARNLLWGAALAAAFPVALVAQQAPSPSQPATNQFYRVYCVKVKPGKAADFANLVNGDLRKYAQSLADSGTISRWGALRALDPSGSEAECDYRFAYFYPGPPPAPMSDEELTAALQKAGLNMNAQQFEEHLHDVGTLVYASINEQVATVGGAKEGDYIVINDMGVKNTHEWIAEEKRLWQPIFEDGLKDGAVDGWTVGVEFMPRGAKDRHITYTVDMYPNWQAVYNFGPSLPDRWKKVHPDVTLNDAMAQDGKLRTIDHTALYQVVATLQASK